MPTPAFGAEALEPRTLLSGTFTQLLHSPPPGGIGTMLLEPDGSVIASLGTSQFARLVPDANGSYVNGTWTVLANPNYTRLYDSTQILPDGRLFIAGGEYGTGAFNGETYDCEFDEAKWAGFQKGSKFKGGIRKLGGLDCSSLVAAR